MFEIAIFLWSNVPYESSQNKRSFNVYEHSAGRAVDFVDFMNR